MRRYDRSPDAPARAQARRAFKETFGMTFHTYVSRRRVERAKEMMVTTDQPLTAIASRCGFADQSHFGRVFRRERNLTPMAYRRQAAH